MPSFLKEFVKELKEKHRYLYLVDISDFANSKLTSSAIVRPLTRREFSFYSELEGHEVERAIVDACVLYPDTDLLDECTLGIDNYLSRAVLNISGFSSEDTLIDGVIEAREEAKSLESAITIYICKAFPKYTPDDVDDMTFMEQMRLVALAEQIIGEPLEYEMFLDPEGYEKNKKREANQLPPQQLTQPERVEEFRRRHAPPVPEGYESVGTDNMVTESNLHQQMQEMRDIFGGS